MAKQKDNEYAGLIPNLHTYLNTIKFLKTAKGAHIDTTDLFLTFLKGVLEKFKKADQDAVIAMLEITEREFFVGINNTAKAALEVEKTEFTIGQQLTNRSKQTRFITEIFKESKKGEIQYGWVDTASGMASVCSEKTLAGWLEK